MNLIARIGSKVVRFVGLVGVLALGLGVGGAAAAEVITGPAGSVAFGTFVTNLPNGKIVVTDPSYSNATAGAKYGAVYLYATNDLVNPLSTITGCDTNDRVGAGGITVLANGNFLIHSPYWSTNCGAVTWVNATNGMLADGAVGGVVAATNSLVGNVSGASGDRVGWYSSGRTVTPLPNGNYVVASSYWNANRGAVTWGDGTRGATGVVSTVNSLVGAESCPDSVGGGGIVVLNNVDSDYVVQSPKVKNGSDHAGAATWCRGTTNFPIGLVTEQNSLVGANADDYVGLYVTALSNGHYVVTSPVWNGGAGAVTWCDGATGRTGAVSVANSLVGSAMDNVGLKDGYIDSNGETSYGTCGVIPLPTGHYLVASYGWNNGGYGTQYGSVSYPYGCGAVTWCNGTTGRVGEVSAANSLVGSTPGDWENWGDLGGDNVGGVGMNYSAGVFVLPNGNYVVASPGWDNGGIDVGAVTWGDGNCGVTGEISAENSLVGSVAGDQLGMNGVCALTNGNYVVPNPYWHNYTGAATWGSGTLGVTGVVSADNSLVGSAEYDQAGGGVYALANGNYVVYSSLNGAGAVTWCDGNLGRTGAVSADNSLVGANIAGVYALAINGNYVVTSPGWDNGPVTDVGAVTWCDGTLGRTGAVSADNSLVGSTAGDQVGYNGVYALPNGNYVVLSVYWNSKPYVKPDGATNMFGCGAVTWGSGTLGVTGVVSAANSLVGTHDYDQVGSWGVRLLVNGNYVVPSPMWTPITFNGWGPEPGLGAVTWGDGTKGVVGAVSPANSLVGSTAGDLVADNLSAQPDGNYVVIFRGCDNAAAEITDAGAVTPASGLLGAKGVISAVNSVLGAAASQGANLVVVYDASQAQLLVGEPGLNQVTLRRVPVSLALDPPNVENYAVTAVLTNGATCQGMLVTTGGAATAVGLLWGSRNGGTDLAAWAHTNWFNHGAVNPAWTDNTLFRTNLTDLADGIASGQTYYYTWVATNAVGTHVAPSSKFFLTGEVTVDATDPLAQYSDNAGVFTISRPAGCTNEGITVPFVLSGSAVHGADYATVPTSVTLAAGATQTNVVITPFYDVDTTNEHVVLTLAAGNGVYPYGTPANAATVEIAHYDHTPVAIATVQAGYWTNGATWSGGNVPELGDEVTLTNDVTLDVSLLFTYGSVSNNASGTLTFRGTNTVLRTTTLLVGGTITHDAQSDTNSAGGWTPDNRIWIQCTDLTVLADGKIDAAGKGYAGGASDNGTGCGNGGGAGSDSSPAGAAHGGVGGAFYGNLSTYGALTNPATPGSGGGGSGSASGGAGGGWVTIEASGIVRVAAGGAIDASGSAGGGVLSGGGSGGCIYLSCDTFQGNGLLRVGGGDGQGGTGGNGGGGRIAVLFNTSAQQAYGGSVPALSVARGAVPTGNVGGVSYTYGQGGSIHVTDPSILSGMFAGGAIFSWASGNPWTLPNLTLSNGVFSLAATGKTVTVAGDVKLLGYEVRLNLTNYTTLTCANLLLTNTPPVLWTRRPSIDVTTLYVYPGVTNATWPLVTARVIVTGNMDVHSNCVVVPSSASYATHEPPDGGVARFEVVNLTIHHGGAFNADTEGYLNANNTAYGPGRGSNDDLVGSGGGYGGVGGASYTNVNVVCLTGGTSYGRAEGPTDPGSAGGRAGPLHWTLGGNGGGCIWITATGVVTNDGTISANGETPYYANAHPKNGGGSGGGVFIVCSRIGGNGTIAANGGNGVVNGDAECSGGGGGGRIAIWCATTPTEVDSYLRFGGTASTNQPSGYTLAKLSAGGGSMFTDIWTNAPAGTKSFYAISAYDSWRYARFTDEELADPLLSGDAADFDGDGLSNLQEYLAGTDPGDPDSCLVITSLPAVLPSSGIFVLNWQSASNKAYAIDAATNLVEGFVLPVAVNVTATPPMNVYTDGVSGTVRKFYRITLEQ